MISLLPHTLAPQIPPLIAPLADAFSTFIYSTTAVVHFVASMETLARNVACPFLPAVAILHDMARHAAMPLLCAVAGIRNATQDAALPLLFVLAVLFHVAKDPE